MRTRTRAEQTARAAKRAPRIAARAAQDSLARDMLPAAVTLTGAVEVTAKDIESAWAQQADQIAADVVNRALAGAGAPLRRVSIAPREVGPAIEKRAEIVSERYLAAVRELSCAFCPAPAPVNPHHVERTGMEERRNDLSAVPACGSGTTGCHGKCHNGRISPERQDQAIAETQARLFEQRGRLWWLGVMKEITKGMEGR